MSTVALTELLGQPVFDPAGGQCGRVRELAVAPQEDRARVAVLIVRTKTGDRVLPFSAVDSIDDGLRVASSASSWPIANGSEGLFFLARDLLDQQIIDVHGRKVVRVNDVELHRDPDSKHPVLRVGSVDVGARGAVRRLLKGVVPVSALRALLRQIPERAIPWDFVDLIDHGLRERIPVYGQDRQDFFARARHLEQPSRFLDNRIKIMHRIFPFHAFKVRPQNLAGTVPRLGANLATRRPADKTTRSPPRSSPRPRSSSTAASPAPTSPPKR